MSAQRFVTGDTRVKEFIPEGILESIRTLQGIHEQLVKYENETSKQAYRWDAFIEDAVNAQNSIMEAIYAMGTIAGNELNYKILNDED